MLRTNILAELNVKEIHFTLKDNDISLKIAGQMF